MPGEVDHLPLPGAMLFDLDGTLVDTVEVRIAAWERALDEARLPAGRARLAPLIGLDGKRLAREIAALDGNPIDEDRAESIDRRSGEIYARLNEAPRSPASPGSSPNSIDGSFAGRSRHRAERRRSPARLRRSACRVSR